MSDQQNVFPRPQRPETPRTDRYGGGWADYVRTVEFVDADPPGPDEAPVHVLRRVLFDGVLAPVSISREDITIDLSGHDATVVTMLVHRDDVQRGDDETPWLIGGRKVLTPTGEGWDWVPVDEDDPDDNPYVVCSIFVAEVHVR